MKKKLSSVLILTLVLVLCLTCLTGCSKFEGTYKLEKVVYVEDNIKTEINMGEEFMGVKLEDDMVVIKILKDSKFSMVNKMDAVTQTLDGYWKESANNKNQIIIKDTLEDADENGLIATFDKNRVSIDMEGLIMIFKKA